jgi:gamma-glutamyl:cysteine ligase YbdK (ATP-grasp superfamily)
MAINSNPAEKLQPDQVQALAALLTCRDIKTAAKQAGVGERTLHTWLKEDAEFQAALKAAEAELLDQTVRRLVASSTEAIEVLTSVMNNKRIAAGVRVRASLGLLDQTIKLKQLNDIEQRLAKLEELNNNAGN